ncbi:dihydroorotase [Edwardsiella tarda]|uniref:dihydroorotase n=1 Tax=Edwardsiella tarda TaxID=636 RepID=UPI00351C181D
MTVMQSTLKIRRPDDWHLHLRDDEMLHSVLPYTSRHFARAMVMPNLTPPVSSVQQCLAYRQRILDAVPQGQRFTPLMTCYLTDALSVDELMLGQREGVFSAAKLYPANATTNSAAGVTSIPALYPLFEAMQQSGLPLLIHGEVTQTDIDIFDREARFIDQVMIPLRRDFPQLRIVFEHITTQEAAQFVAEGDRYLAATITPQHLMFNRNHMLVGGIRPHLYCLPILKRSVHQQALRKAATSGQSCFFLGTDSAPHLRGRKESACGCAGVFNAPSALQAYATVFEQEQALQHLEAFCSLNGPAFYGLPANEEYIELVQEPATMVDSIACGEETLIPFLAGETLRWSVRD